MGISQGYPRLYRRTCPIERRGSPFPRVSRPAPSSPGLGNHARIPGRPSPPLSYSRPFEIAVRLGGERAGPRGPSVWVACHGGRERGTGGEREGEREWSKCLLGPCFGSDQHRRGGTRAHVDRTAVRRNERKRDLPCIWQTSGDAEGLGRADRTRNPRTYGTCVRTKRPRVCIIARCTNLHVLAWAA